MILQPRMSPESAPPSSRVSRRGLALTGLAGALIVVLVVVNGVWSRNASEARLKEETGQQAIPIVAVVTPTLGANRSSLDLPGRLEAYMIRTGYRGSWPNTETTQPKKTH